MVESGDALIGKWVIERRNVLEDFKALFGKHLNAPWPSACRSTASIHNQLPERSGGPYISSLSEALQYVDLLPPRLQARESASSFRRPECWLAVLLHGTTQIFVLGVSFPYCLALRGKPFPGRCFRPARLGNAQKVWRISNLID